VSSPRAEANCRRLMPSESGTECLQGGSLQRYYPLSDEARPEYEAWRKLNPIKAPPPKTG